MTGIGKELGAPAGMHRPIEDARRYPLKRSSVAGVKKLDVERQRVLQGGTSAGPIELQPVPVWITNVELPCAPGRVSGHQPRTMTGRLFRYRSGALELGEKNVNVLDDEAVCRPINRMGPL